MSNRYYMCRRIENGGQAVEAPPIHGSISLLIEMLGRKREGLGGTNQPRLPLSLRKSPLYKGYKGGRIERSEIRLRHIYEYMYIHVCMEYVCMGVHTVQI